MPNAPAFRARLRLRNSPNAVSSFVVGHSGWLINPSPKKAQGVELDANGYPKDLRRYWLADCVS